MSSYDWFALVTLGLDRWNEPRPPRTAYEIERDEAWHLQEAHLAATRRARRAALYQALRNGVARAFKRRSPDRPPCARPRKPTSRA